jgi:hypothetical protein
MIRGARLYFAETAKPAIVAATHRSTDGVWFEQESPELLPNWRDDPAALAAAMFRAIERFSTKNADFRTHKKTVWPAFRASKCRSVNAFELAYDRIFVCSLNDRELFFDAEMSPRGEDNIELHVILSKNPAEDGRRLLRLLHACRRWEPLPFSAGLSD